LSRVRGQPARTVLRRRQAQQCACRYPTGHHPLLAFCDNTGEPLTWMLRRGSAGSNTAADHITVVDDSIAALPPKLRRDLMVTVDGAGFSHKLLEHLDKLASRRGHTLIYSCGWELDQREKAAIRLVPEHAWEIAIDHRGEVRERRADDATCPPPPRAGAGRTPTSTPGTASMPGSRTASAPARTPGSAGSPPTATPSTRPG